MFCVQIFKDVCMVSQILCWRCIIWCFAEIPTKMSSNILAAVKLCITKGFNSQYWRESLGHRSYNQCIIMAIAIDSELGGVSLAYPTDTPPSSLSIAMATIMHWLYDQQPNDSLQYCDIQSLVAQSFTAASTLDDILVDIFRKTSNYTPSKMSAWQAKSSAEGV